MEPLALLALAVALDLLLGDPPSLFHPVAWIGKLAILAERGLSLRSRAGQIICGMVVLLFTIALFTIPAHYMLVYTSEWNNIGYIFVGTVLLKMTFSIRGLSRAALQIKDLLIKDKCREARIQLKVLVSRDAKGLRQSQIISATVESIAENTSDSIIAPLFYFLLFGIPGALAYRVVNTFDAQIGYHGKYEYLGKFASRLDDIMNYIPARITALLLVISGFMVRRNGWNALRIAIADHRKTESPNAGWPIAVMAGALSVQLEKISHYRLGTMERTIGQHTISESLHLMNGAVALWVTLCLAGGGLYFAITN